MSFPKKRIIDVEKCCLEVESWLRRYVDTRRIPGGIVGVHQHGDKVVSLAVGASELFGKGGLTPSHCYQIHSMTKPLAAAATLVLVEDGAFTLDEPISKFLPEFKTMKVLQSPGDFQTVDAKSPITARHLLSHTSGLAHPLFDNGPIRALYDEKDIPAEDGGPDLAKTVARIAELPLLYQPGTRWHYGCNYHVLTHLIEVTSGLPFAEFLRAKILDPLGISPRTGYFPQVSTPDLLVPLHRFADDGTLRVARDEGKLRPGVRPSAHTGMYSTVDDYMKFAVMLSENGMSKGRRILTKGSVDTIMSNQLPGTMATVGQTVYRGKSYHGHGYGFGLAVLLDPSEAGSVANAGEAGCGSLASSFFWVDRSIGLAVVMLTNVAPSSVLPLRKELREIVYGALR